MLLLLIKYVRSFRLRGLYRLCDMFEWYLLKSIREWWEIDFRNRYLDNFCRYRILIKLKIDLWDNRWLMKFVQWSDTLLLKHIHIHSDILFISVHESIQNILCRRNQNFLVNRSLRFRVHLMSFCNFWKLWRSRWS